jgi:Fe-S cluster assembly protein SufD
MLMDEDWKYTQIAESAFQDYAWANEQPAAGDRIDCESLYASRIPPNSAVFVFENGALVAQSKNCPIGVSLSTSDASVDSTVSSKSPQWLTICAEAALEQQHRKWDWAFTETLSAPLYILHFYTGSRPKQAIFARHRVTVAAHVSATVVEIYGDLYDNNLRGLCYGQSHITLAEGAVLQHHRLSLATAGMTSLADVDVKIGSKASYDLCTIMSGGKQHRSNTLLSLTGVAAKVKVKCLHWANHQESLDTHLEVRHEADNGESDVLIRGIAERRATSSVTGKIVIPKTASQNSAQLENKNLLLSREASINSRPQLEISHDSIQRCTHGATVGCLDDEALFYLQSRGIPVAEAKKMLMDSFIEPVLSAFSPAFVEDIRAQLLGMPAPVVLRHPVSSPVIETAPVE